MDTWGGCGEQANGHHPHHLSQEAANLRLRLSSLGQQTSSQQLRTLLESVRSKEVWVVYGEAWALCSLRMSPPKAGWDPGARKESWR